MKFQYSPGLFGYGAKGADGEAGQQGLMMYFTDYDTNNDKLIIEAAIQNNEDLWVSSEPGTLLPGGRVYNEGDLFVNTSGRVYKIDNPDTGDFILIGKIDTDTLFDTKGLMTNGFERYYNIHPIDSFDQTNFIIDDVHSKSPGNYLNSPSSIYGIAPKNFAKVQYVDVVNSSSNAFTLFSSAEFPDETSRAFGIIRETDSNLFRIGNIGEDGNIRKTEIMFDVSSLRRFVSNSKSENPQSFLLGENEILRNDIINANKLFEGVFDSNPASFEVISSSTEKTEISWNIADFVQNATNVQAEIYFYDSTTFGQFNPLVFYTTSSTGTIAITDLIEDNLYSCFMKIFVNGWGRRSVTRTVKSDGSGEKTLVVVNPASLTLSASDNGTIAGSPTYSVDFSTNSLTGWSTTSSSWITCTPSSAITYSGPDFETFDVSISVLTGKPRNGFIDIISQAPTQRITVSQGTFIIAPTSIDINFDNDGSINTSVLGSNIIDVSIYMRVGAFIFADSGAVINSRLFAYNPTLLKQISTTSIVPPGNPTVVEFNLSVKDINSGSILYFMTDFYANILPNDGDIISGTAKAKITNIVKKSGPDTISTQWNTWISEFDGINTNSYRAAE